MDYKIVLLSLIALIGILIEAIYSPRLEFTNKNILLFYYLPFTKKRVYKILK